MGNEYKVEIEKALENTNVALPDIDLTINDTATINTTVGLDSNMKPTVTVEVDLQF